jgi:hypothetical protein
MVISSLLGKTVSAKTQRFDQSELTQGEAQFTRTFDAKSKLTGVETAIQPRGLLHINATDFPLPMQVGRRLFPKRFRARRVKRKHNQETVAGLPNLIFRCRVETTAPE